MMVTDDERREVAKRLRGLNGNISHVRRVYEAEGISILCDDQADYYQICDMVTGYLPAEHMHPCDYKEMHDRLADLIEPARGSGGRSILCAHCESVPWCGCEPGDLEGGCDFEPRVDEGEPPYNLYSLYEVVFRRRPRDESAIEDDEVRELVGALLDICNAPGHEHIKPCDASLSCRDTVACDREALLELAEECDEMRDNGCSIGSYEVYRIARRIREAIGVTP